jgi:hypothetical protein
MPDLVPIDYDPFGQQRPMMQAPDGSWSPYQPQTAAAAGSAALDATGIPLLRDAWASAQRGEYLPAIGQAGVGAAQLGSLAFPALRAGGAVAGEALNTMPAILTDTAGTLKLPQNALLRIRELTGDRLAGEMGGRAAGDPSRSFSSIAAGDRPLEAGVDPIRAYHASPHDFPSFDSSKIGTGEGAQAYSHGLYFGGAKKTADFYYDQFKAMGGTPPTLELGGKPVSFDAHMVPQGVESPRERRALTSVQQLFNSYAPHELTPEVVDSAKEALRERLQLADSAHKAGRSIINPIADVSWRENMRAELELLERPDFKVKAGEAGKAHMYEADLHVRPEHLGDYDKPLSEQSPYVSERLRGIMTPSEQARQSSWEAPGWSDAPGRSYADTVKLGTWIDRRAGEGLPIEQQLRDAGIPGVKYLDQGSRAAGEGSHNYVIYDDKLIDIVKKYGVAALGLPAGAGALVPVDHDPQF